MLRAGGPTDTRNLMPATYSANSLNQYSQKTVPGTVQFVTPAWLAFDLHFRVCLRGQHSLYITA